MPSDEDRLRIVLKSPELQGRVRHLGRLPFTDIMQIMSASHAFLMPNIPVQGDMEGFGLVCIEANLRGLPVFASNLEGITDAVQDQKNGWLLAANDSAAWLNALDVLKQDPEFVRHFGVQARQYVLENFGWEKMTAAYFHHFNNKLGCNNRPAQAKVSLKSLNSL
jgi:phosphatidylinositol alpha-1,6-mannosyltransferase